MDPTLSPLAGKTSYTSSGTDTPAQKRPTLQGHSITVAIPDQSDLTQQEVASRTNLPSLQHSKIYFSLAKKYERELSSYEATLQRYQTSTRSPLSPSLKSLIKATESIKKLLHLLPSLSEEELSQLKDEEGMLSVTESSQTAELLDIDESNTTLAASRGHLLMTQKHAYIQSSIALHLALQHPGVEHLGISLEKRWNDTASKFLKVAAEAERQLAQGEKSWDSSRLGALFFKAIEAKTESHTATEIATNPDSGFCTIS